MNSVAKAQKVTDWQKKICEQGVFSRDSRRNRVKKVPRGMQRLSKRFELSPPRLSWESATILVSEVRFLGSPRHFIYEMVTAMCSGNPGI